MNVKELLRLGFSHTRNAVAEKLYLNNGLDFTKPITFHLLVNERCKKNT